MDMYLDGLVGLIEETYDGNDYGFLVSANDTILVHPNKEYSLDNTVSKLLKDVNRGAYESVVEDDLKTSIKLDYKGGFKFMTSQTSSLTGWKVVYVKSTFKVLILLVGILAFAVAVFIITSRVAATKAINKISHLFTPLESIANKVIRIAKGDLSVEFDEEKSSSEVEKLIDNLNETVESMRGYIGRISDIVESISDKDLTVSVDGDFQGNYVAIREGLEQILDSLNSSFEQINNESEIVFKYAHQLEKTTENVANSSIEQNDSVTTVVTEMDALNNQAKKINDSAMQVLDNADVTNRHMEDGTEKMADLVEAMNRIEDCYSKISDFVVEINSIAEETNLLSLNASIEAARAGEAGKGFAVVASEISSLAESSAKASENIRELIYVTSEAVAHGKKLVDTTSDSISQGKDDALKTKEYVNAIVEFVEKQKNAIEKIGNSLKTISVMVDNGAASAQENTVISQQLGESAKHLKETVGAFSLK
jgi:methyl-accepting chemotaxis protein